MMMHRRLIAISIGAGINLGGVLEGPLDLNGFPRVRGAAIDIGAYEQSRIAQSRPLNRRSRYFRSGI